MCNHIIPRLSLSFLDEVGFWPGFWWQGGSFLLMFHDFYFVSSWPKTHCVVDVLLAGTITFLIYSPHNRIQSSIHCVIYNKK